MIDMLFSVQCVCVIDILVVLFSPDWFVLIIDFFDCSHFIYCFCYSLWLLCLFNLLKIFFVSRCNQSIVIITLRISLEMELELLAFSSVQFQNQCLLS